jgi:hypothetical protein
MNVVWVEIGMEVAQFPEKEYINGFFVAVWYNPKSEGNFLELL